MQFWSLYCRSVGAHLEREIPGVVNTSLESWGSRAHLEISLVFGKRDIPQMNTNSTTSGLVEYCGVRGSATGGVHYEETYGLLFSMSPQYAKLSTCYHHNVRLQFWSALSGYLRDHGPCPAGVLPLLPSKALEESEIIRIMVKYTICKGVPAYSPQRGRSLRSLGDSRFGAT